MHDMTLKRQMSKRKSCIQCIIVGTFGGLILGALSMWVPQLIKPHFAEPVTLVALVTLGLGLMGGFFGFLYAQSLTTMDPP